MKLEEVLKKATPLPLELIVGEGTCFHEGNTVSIQKLHEPSQDNGFEGAGETIAEFWPAHSGIEKIDAALYLHCRNKFEGLLEAFKFVMGWCDDSHDFDDEPCLVRARAAIKDAEEVDVYGS